MAVTSSELGEPSQLQYLREAQQVRVQWSTPSPLDGLKEASGGVSVKIRWEAGTGRRAGLGANGRGEDGNSELLVWLLSLCKLQGLISKWDDSHASLSSKRAERKCP